MEHLQPLDGAALRGNEAMQEEIARRFERDGIVVLTNFVGATELARINREIDAHYAPLLARARELLETETPEKRQFECDVLAWNPCAEGSEPFTRLQAMPELESATRACLGDGFSAPDSLVMLSTAGGRGQAWHQDCATTDPSQFNLNRLFYTRDVTHEDGAIVVVPGSHRGGRIPPGGNQEPIAGELALAPRAGTLVLLHGRVFHRVTPNVSGNARISVNFRSFPKQATPEVCRVGIYRNGNYDFVANKVVE